MQPLLIGATGQIGSALAPGACPVPRSRVDLAEPFSIDSFFATPLAGSAPCLINAAAFTAVDAAEDPAHRETCWAINATAPGQLAERAAEAGMPFIHISTDYVFNGRCPLGRENAVDDPTDPINEYGRSKLAGEEAVLRHGGHVVRTSWVYTPRSGFVATMRTLAEQGVNPNVVNDQWGRPAEACVVASAIRELAERIVEGERVPRLLHVAGSGPVTTWYELARRVFELSGHDPERVTAIPSSEYPTPAERPKNSALDISAWEFEPLPAWQESLARALR